MQSEKSRTARRPRALKRAFAVAIAAGSTCFSVGASARPEYPGELKDALDMVCIPSCMLCHTRPEGGNEYVNSFGYIGLGQKNNPASSFSNDFDGDGDMDGDELKKGANPAQDGDGSICAPEYGCGARIAPVPPDGSLKVEQWVLGVLGLGIVLRWQLRRRAAARRPAPRP